MLYSLSACFYSYSSLDSFDVIDFGAKGNGIDDDSAAFEAAIAAVSQNQGASIFFAHASLLLNVYSYSRALALLLANQGGQVVVPEGVFLIRPINLTSSMELFIRSGATIRGIANTSAWPIIAPVPSYGQGRDMNPHSARYTSLLHGVNVSSVTIRGEGLRSVVDGQGDYWYNRSRAFLYESCKECPDTRWCCLNNTRGHLIEFMYVGKKV